MTFPWTIVIALGVLAFAFFIKHVGDVIFEEKHHFWMAIAAFFVLFITAACAIGWMNPLQLIPGTTPPPTVLSLPF